MRKTVNVLIPMAGAGSRFHQAGYSKPKPLIKVFDKTMIRQSIDTLKLKGIDCNYIFVARHYSEREHVIELESELRSIDPCCKIVWIKELTEGSACTCLLAKDSVDQSLPLFIYNCDQIFNFSQTTVNKIYNLLNSDYDGAVITWKDTDPKNSFTEVSPDNLCLYFTEKRPVSDNALIGFHYWKKSSDFFSSAEEMIESKFKFNNEYYIAPTYNQLIKQKKKILNICIEKNECYLIGTPKDLDFYLSIPKISSIIFDLDGVIADTEHLHKNALKQAISEAGYYSEFIEYVPVNLTSEEKINYIADKFYKIASIRDHKEVIVKRKRELYDEMIYNAKFSNADNVFDILNLLELYKINYYIVTNSSKSSAYKLLSKLGLYNTFKHKIICADDCINHKPYSEPYVRAIVKFELSIDSTFVIEDSDEGRLSATSAGLRCVQIKNSYELTEELINTIIQMSRKQQ